MMNSLSNKQAGTSLVEVLVTLLVLSVGALGIAGLQLTALKYNSGAYVRTQASLLSNDFMDRMRANRAVALDTGDYLIATATTFEGAGGTAPTSNCANAACTEAEIAEVDKFNWLTSVSSLLPLGQARVTAQDVGEQRLYSITLQWRQIVNQQGGTNLDDELNTFTFTGAL